MQQPHRPACGWMCSTAALWRASWASSMCSSAARLRAPPTLTCVPCGTLRVVVSQELTSEVGFDRSAGACACSPCLAGLRMPRVSWPLPHVESRGQDVTAFLAPSMSHLGCYWLTPAATRLLADHAVHGARSHRRNTLGPADLCAAPASGLRARGRHRGGHYCRAQEGEPSAHGGKHSVIW